MSFDYDVFDRPVCELQEQEDINDQPMGCVEPASSTVRSGDLKGTHVCPIHSNRLKDDGYDIIDELVDEDNL